ENLDSAIQLAKKIPDFDFSDLLIEHLKATLQSNIPIEEIQQRLDQYFSETFKTEKIYKNLAKIFGNIKSFEQIEFLLNLLQTCENSNHEVNIFELDVF